MAIRPGKGARAKTLRVVYFAGALTLTHNATTLILPGATNIAIAAGDSAIFLSDASGNWRAPEPAVMQGAQLKAHEKQDHLSHIHEHLVERTVHEGGVNCYNRM